MTLKKINLVLLIILGLFFIKGLYLILIIPPWEAPDEGGHVKYVTYLYENRRIPSLNTSGKTNGISINASRKYQTDLILKNIKNKEWIEPVELFDRRRFNMEKGVDNITFYPPLYYLYLLPFYSASNNLPSYFSLIFLRIGSLILGTFSLFMTYKISQILFPKSRGYALLISFLMSLQPMFTFISSVVNNDNLTILSFLSFTYLGLKILDQKVSDKTFIILGFITGASTLVKPQLLILIPLYALLIFFKLKDKNKKILYLIFSLIIPFIWYVLITHLSFSKAITSIEVIPDYSLIWKYPYSFISSKQIGGIFVTFWGDFGWLNIPMPKWTYLIFALILITSCVGWIKSRTIKLKWKFLLNSQTFILLSIAFLGGALLVFDILHFANIHNFSLQGRYFLPILPFVLIFIIKGLSFFNTPLNKFLLISLLITFLIVQVVMYISISNFYYSRFIIIPPLPGIYT